MAAAPVISVVGRNSSARADLLARLIGVLAARNYRIAALKHTPHTHGRDCPDRDAVRYAEAGAAASALVAPDGTRLFLAQTLTGGEPARALRDLLDVHLIIIEAENCGNVDKIEVIPHGCSSLFCADPLLRAVVAARADPQAPRCFAPHDIRGLSLFIESHYIQPAISAAVLAGGRSRRLGTDKASVKIGAKPLLEHVLAVIRPLVSPVQIVGRSSGEVSDDGIAVCADILPGGGPLSGIHAALVNADSEYVLVCSCDMPLLTPESIQRLLASYPGADITLYKHRYFEPLCAVYRRSCIPALEDLIAHGEYRIIDLFPTLSVRVLRTGDAAIFKSINTPEDYQYVIERLRA